MRESETGFELRIAVATGQMQISLQRLSDEPHFAESLPLPVEASAEQPVDEAAAAEGMERLALLAANRFHQRLMSPTLSLTAEQINALSASSGTFRARRQVEGLLDMLKPKQAQDEAAAKK